MRSAPIAAVLAMPVLAFALDQRLKTVCVARSARLPESQGRRALNLIAAGIIVLAAWVTLVPPNLEASIRDETARRFPVRSVDLLDRVAADSRVFAEYSWGGYVAYRLHERGGSTFIDGRNDMFDQEILEDYSTIRAADQGWDERLRLYDATAILLPPEAPLVRGPALDGGWCEAYRSESEVLLLKTCPVS